MWSLYELGYYDGYYGYYSDPLYDWSREYMEGYEHGEYDAFWW